MSDHSSYDNVSKNEESPPRTPTNLPENPANSRINSMFYNRKPCPEDMTEGRKNLNKWLGHTFRVVITDGRVLVGFFNCTDKDANVVLSMCAEYLEEGKDARILGNVMIPGKHIVSISIDMPKDGFPATEDSKTPAPSAPLMEQ